VGDPSETMSFLRNGTGFQSQVAQVQEAEMRSSAMSNIVGVVLSNEMLDMYNKYPRIHQDLCLEYKSSLKNEIIPGFKPLGQGEEVNEGEEYPIISTSDKYVSIPEAKKRGGIVHVTEEAILYDQTGRLLETARSLVEEIAEKEEYDALKRIVGAEQCYYPQGVGTDLYQAAPFLVASNALVDWTDVEKAMVEGLGAMVDENGNPTNSLAANPILLCSTAKEMTARRIVNATEIRHGSDPVVLSSNPLNGQGIQVKSSVFIHQILGNTSAWFYGDPRKQFRKFLRWPLQVFRLNSNNMLEFTRDIKFSYKVRHWSWIFVKENRYFVKCQEGA
jgi:hypothetical protein